MEYLKLIRQPDISMVAGIKVTKDTDLVFENEDGKELTKDGENFTTCVDVESTEGWVEIEVPKTRTKVNP